MAQDFGILPQRAMDDLVTGDGRRALARECLEGLALAGPDRAGDRDR